MTNKLINRKIKILINYKTMRYQLQFIINNNNKNKNTNKTMKSQLQFIIIIIVYYYYYYYSFISEKSELSSYFFSDPCARYKDPNRDFCQGSSVLLP